MFLHIIYILYTHSKDIKCTDPFHLKLKVLNGKVGKHQNFYGYFMYICIKGYEYSPTYIKAIYIWLMKILGIIRIILQ